MDELIQFQDERIPDNSVWGEDYLKSVPEFTGKKGEVIDPASFEKPSDDFDAIASAVVAYTHCNLDKKGGYYQAIMTSGVERWYPGIESNKSPSRDKFESDRFEEWKHNIINLDAQTAIAKYGRGEIFDSLKKLHNYLKSGQDASSQAELLRSCFDGDDSGFDAAFYHLRYDRHSDPGWYYYSSRDEKIGFEDRIQADGRLYLNAEPMDTFNIAGKFVDVCKETGLPYEFKINRNPDRADAMVFYIDNKNISDYVNIINKILNDNPSISSRIGKPPLLTEKVSDKIGYGDENGNSSYNDRQCEKFQKTIEATVQSYRGEIPQGSIQERARFLYINQYEKFMNVLKSRLH